MCVGQGGGRCGKKWAIREEEEGEAFVLWVLFGEEEEDTTAVTIRKRLLTVGIYLAYHFLPLPTHHELYSFLFAPLDNSIYLD